MLQIHQFPCLSDNYGFLIHDPTSGATAAIDTPDADEIMRQADAKGWRVTDIWNTHWHPDHAGGNAAIKAKTGARVTGPREVERISAAPDRVVDEGDRVQLGGIEACVLNVGGHTLGHIAYVFDAEKVAFVGDALFSMGCGRLFEGTPEQMWTSLSKIAALPRDTTLYCAHEYTEANARFAIYYDPINQDLQARVAEVKRLRAEGKPTVPMSLDLELRTNPFLRAPLLKHSIMKPEATDVEAFADLRARKDSFK
ncbi:hydroxyacylglutathione hydrolase [Terricaulis silvestris]|uniref:Hydroxyacylglutathione hydrolase n=1 Tax=Terricaulis silvestris TaxID=2686094 RepID=A0A6I6MRK9_9CAUL|nr:hydroxyacylglutathione hydrolase [Terricaulis silvestris]QGZ96066.1 Hydroxyacylglutathione hydrolase [Terricaulis silvestris]